MLTSTLEEPAFIDFLTGNPTKEIFHHENENEYLHAVGKVTQSVKKFLNNNKQPFSGISPANLKSLFDAIDFEKTHDNYDALLNEVEQLYTNHAVAFHHPAYIAHLNCPVVIPAVAAEVMISAINSSIDTWDQSAGGTLIEKKLVEWTCDQIGYSKTADGIFTSGGTQSNLMGLLLARDHYAITVLNHNIKVNGLPQEASRFRIFVSEKAHFSIQKNASLLGLGEKSVIKIKTDRSFRMNIVLLEDAIKRALSQGNIPIAIVGTAGTTDFGNVDPLREIAAISKKYKTWFHIDAAYGCGLLLTDKYRNLLQGIELAHSVTVDYHKSFFQPVSSSGFLVRDKNFFNLITHHADYLNPKDHDEDGLPNQVNKSIQTTRRFDALKLWFTLRMMGREKLGSYFDTIIETAAKIADLLRLDGDFELMNESDISALVFRYHPKNARLDVCAMNQYIKKTMFNEGKALIAGTKINQQFYLKFTLLNPITTINDIENIIKIIKKHGNEYVTLNQASADFRRN
ncbi:pyridoxal phosphate-dependent decarboxylase family protein [Pedobacter rhodius]|uniref:Aspartate aminotransferase family protein n=1 Tax=Pedobacter rhodius TaxID=3004098 RepID=A0ABT4KWZ9_9SPHI|nr:aspartate aminotransferase family protein [Pedobacter sp. SJ11]MCZ4223429.1 aspartate aminotransferase family protein [Pedobacter sp. SJ11]